MKFKTEPRLLVSNSIPPVQIRIILYSVMFSLHTHLSFLGPMVNL